MNVINAVILQAAPEGMGSMISTLIPFLLIIVVFYFLIMRPQQKRQKERQALLSSVKKGDKIITAGGIHGVVEGIEENTILVKIDDNVKVKMEKTGITTIKGLTDAPVKK